MFDAKMLKNIRWLVLFLLLLVAPVWRIVTTGRRMSSFAPPSSTAAAAARIKSITTAEQNDDEDEDEDGTTNQDAIIRIQFTQGWSTGHVGTNFLTELFSKVTRVSSAGSNSSPVGNDEDDDEEEQEEIVDPWWLVWNEHELDIGPFLTPNNSERDCDTRSSSNSNTDDDTTIVTIKALQHYMLKGNTKLQKWYGKHLKQWNLEGDLASIRHYIQSERLPTITAVIAYFYCHRHPNNTTNNVHKNNTHATNNNNNNNKTPPSSSLSSSSQFLHHLIKFGHTSIFYNLPTLYDEFTNTKTILTKKYNNQNISLQIEFDMDFLRIVRKRRYIARSFALDARISHVDRVGRFRPGPCFYRTKWAGIVTCPYYATSLLQLKSTSRTDTTLWNSWSSFQQHLWFVDEIQAQWLHFLSLYNNTTNTNTNTNTTKTSIRYHTLQYDDHDKISVQEIDKLAKYLNLPVSPRKYMQSTNKKSHLKTTNSNTNIMLSEEIMKQQAIEYAQTAPWCIQYNTTTNSDDDDDGNNHSQLRYPILIDCSYDS